MNHVALILSHATTGNKIKAVAVGTILLIVAEETTTSRETTDLAEKNLAIQDAATDLKTILNRKIIVIAIHAIIKDHANADLATQRNVVSK